MELKFVYRTRPFSESFPFENMARRCSGTGKMANDGREWVITQQIGDKAQPVEFLNVAIGGLMRGDCVEGKFVKFLRIMGSDDIHKTFVWDFDEVDAYLVNDDGKTVDKL